MDTDARNLTIRIRDAAGEWNDKELSAEEVVSEMYDAIQNQEILIRSLRPALEQAERQRDEAEEGRAHWKRYYESARRAVDEITRERDWYKEQLEQQANFNPDWDRLRACQESLRQHVYLLEQVSDQRDEARGLLREIDKRHLTRDMAEKVEAHLRGEGD